VAGDVFETGGELDLDYARWDGEVPDFEADFGREIGEAVKLSVCRGRHCFHRTLKT
jgi:hypothetical protein